MTPNEPPVFACRLDAMSATERARHAELIHSFAASVAEKHELPDGFAFRLRGGDRTFQVVAEWITLERRCCPFLGFALEWSGEGEPWLKLTGAPGVKAFILAEFPVTPG